MIINRGGKNEQRLYLYDLKIDHEDDTAIIKKSDFPNMEDLIARHKSRYMLPAMFCRPKMMVLDFPCGSGYGAKLLNEFGVYYEGLDFDDVTIEYARTYYGNERTRFDVGNLCKPNLKFNRYDIIACIEGIEHIGKEYQVNLILAFFNALKEDGIFTITMPEGKTNNPYHVGEMTGKEFLDLLSTVFIDIQAIEHYDKDHNGNENVWYYGVCRK